MSLETWAPAPYLLAVVSAGLAWYFHLRSKRRKYLDYEVISNRQLLASAASVVRGNLEVRYDGVAVSDPRLIVLRLENTGNVEIRKDDFAQPLAITVGKGATFLSAEVSATMPDGLRVDVQKPWKGRLELAPLLLNAGDYIELQLIVEGSADDPSAAGRIAGVSEIRDSQVIRLLRGGRNGDAWRVVSLLGAGIITVAHVTTDGQAAFPNWLAVGGLFVLLISLFGERAAERETRKWLRRRIQQ